MMSTSGHSIRFEGPARDTTSSEANLACYARRHQREGLVERRATYPGLRDISTIGRTDEGFFAINTSLIRPRAPGAHRAVDAEAGRKACDFFVNVMGMTESGRRGDSVYLRGWDDYEHHTLKLTASKVAGMGHMAFRATSPEALSGAPRSSRRPASARDGPTAISATGRAYAFTTTDGHNMEIYYETEWYAPPPAAEAGAEEPGAALSGARRQRPAARPSQPAGRRRRARSGTSSRTSLGMRTTEMIVLDNGEEAGAWVTTTNKSYDLAFTADHYGARGRFHHRHLCGRLPRGGAARGRHLSRERRPHRDRAAQARRSSRRSSCTCTSRAATASRSTTPARG